MKKSVERCVVLSIALLLLVALAGCGGSKTAEKKGGDYTIVVGIPSAIKILDPAMHRDRATETVIRNMFDGLVTRTPGMDIVPELAESWEAMSPTEWVFRLRKGVTFHNGEAMTADDVVFTYERILKEGGVGGQSSPRKGLLGPLTKVEKVDDYTVRFILSAPWPVFLAMMPHQQIVPKDYITEKGDAYFAEHPVGTGPFQFVSANLSEEIVMERYENYYGGSPAIQPVGKAPAKRVVFKIIPEPSTRIAALESGDVQIVQDVPASAIGKLKANANVVVKLTTGTRVNFFAMNVTKPPFNSVKVRQAMNYAVNMEEIVATILGGTGTVMAGPVIPASFAYNNSLKPYGYNPEKAKQLLAEAGYPKGFQLVIDCEEPEKEITEAVAIQLRAIGLDASVRVWDWGVLEPLLDAGERNMLMNYWGNSTMDPFDLLNPLFLTNGRGNYCKYSNARVDQLLNEAGTIVDQAKRKEMYDEVQTILYNDAPYIFSYVNEVIEACSAGIKNWQPSPDGRLNLHDVTLQ